MIPIDYIKNNLRGIACYNIDVLRKYLGSPLFTCIFCSDTYGSIDGTDFHISFGTINHKIIFLWGIDFFTLPKNQQSHFKEYAVKLDAQWLETIEKTDFYQAQINIVFTDPIQEVSIFQQYDILNNLWITKFGYKLFKEDDHNTEYILNLCTKYKKIILGSFDDFRSFITEWDILILERLNKDCLLQHAQKLGIIIEQGHGSRIILENILKKLGLLPVGSFKVLNKLRNYVDHKNDQNKEQEYLNICRQISCMKDDYSKIYYHTVNNLLKDISELGISLQKFK